jgi:hypothetical protein
MVKKQEQEFKIEFTDEKPWEQMFVNKIVEKYAKRHAIPNMVAVHSKTGHTEVMPFPAPNTELQEQVLAMMRTAVRQHKDEIQEVALIANVMESLSEDEQPAKDSPKTEAVMIFFETRKGVSLRRFHVVDGQLKEVVDHDMASVEASFSLGLFEKMPDLGGMYR